MRYCRYTVRREKQAHFCSATHVSEFDCNDRRNFAASDASIPRKGRRGERVIHPRSSRSAVLHSHFAKAEPVLSACPGCPWPGYDAERHCIDAVVISGQIAWRLLPREFALKSEIQVCWLRWWRKLRAITRRKQQTPPCIGGGHNGILGFQCMPLRMSASISIATNERTPQDHRYGPLGQLACVIRKRQRALLRRPLRNPIRCFRRPANCYFLAPFGESHRAGGPQERNRDLLRAASDARCSERIDRAVLPEKAGSARRWSPPQGTSFRSWDIPSSGDPIGDGRERPSWYLRLGRPPCKYHRQCTSTDRCERGGYRSAR